ncbi:glycosyltransferase family 4 protein [candidate division KSB1 bacterium]|nr:glycosyltransferase family 4 protein [candidate division KSB1 bacterium]
MTYSILVINWQDISNPFGGGAEVHLHEIFKRIAQQGHTVTLLCSSYAGAAEEKTIDGIHIIRRGSRSMFNFHVPWMCRKIVKTMHVDIVIDDINKIPFYTPLYVRRPLIGIIHHLFGKSIFIEASLPAAMYVNTAERLVPWVYRTIPMTVVSQSTKNELLAKGFHEQNIHIIHNGVDTAAYKTIPKKRSEFPYIGYLGRIKKYKSVDHLLLAFKRVRNKIPDAQLVIIGDGDYLHTLHELTDSLELSHAVTFAGAANEQQKQEYLNHVWFTVNPSPKEGWGLTVIESNACGSPVIAADSPGLRDSVANEHSGLLYPYGDIEALANTMIQLIENPAQLRALRHNCVPWAQQFSWDVSAQKMLDLIHETVSSYNPEN